MRSGTTRGMTIILLLLAPFSLPAFVMGQDIPPDSLPPPIAEETALTRAGKNLGILDSLRTSIQEIVRTQGVEGEERQLLRAEILNLVEDTADLTSETVRVLAEQDSADAVADSLIELAKDHVKYQTGLFLQSIRSFRGQVSDMRAQRAELPPGELLEFETFFSAELDVYDQILSWAVESGFLMETLGMNASKFWREFDRYIQERADGLSGRLQLSKREENQLRQQISDAEKAGALESEVGVLRIQLQSAERRVQTNVKSLTRAANIMDRRDINTDKYRLIIIESTGEVTKDILDREVFLGLVSQVWKNVTKWFTENGPNIAIKFAILVLFILAFRIGAVILFWMVRFFRRKRKSSLLQNLVGRLIRPFASLAGLIAGLSFLGVNPTTLLTGLGVASVIIGLALQDSLSNLAAGFFILVNRPYDVDDVVIAGGVMGSVKEMGLASTTIITFDNRRLMVPNRKIWGEVIENRSVLKKRRVDMFYPVGHREDIPTIIKLIREVLASHPMVLDDPAPQVFIKEIEDSWVNLAVWPWAKVEDWWEMKKQLPDLLRERLAQEGIQFPYPYRQIEMSSGDASSGKPPTEPGSNPI